MTTTFFTIGGVFLFINCLYLIIAYCYLFFALRKQNSRIGKSQTISKSNMEYRKREKRLFIMCSIIVAVQLTILSFFSLRALQLFELSVDEFYLFYNALSDLFACINPYLLWIFSDALRKYVFMTLGIGPCGSGRATVAVTIQTVGN
ncbi:hypothetical protein CAEBREN_32532 [Caenorhabditis brenneri]|uniref:G-protein coupled receptors family 1 profile domain-containing protein n=1 Tax=Caenorhabditis brenneri TaxID=135651 RepID=G0MR69_CAEBE|nr:hypothetical protein CAEBREN_32532 [Caenorhabditis brenneri]